MVDILIYTFTFTNHENRGERFIYVNILSSHRSIGPIIFKYQNSIDYVVVTCFVPKTSHLVHSSTSPKTHSIPQHRVKDLFTLYGITCSFQCTKMNYSTCLLDSTGLLRSPNSHHGWFMDAIWCYRRHPSSTRLQHQSHKIHHNHTYTLKKNKVTWHNSYVLLYIWDLYILTLLTYLLRASPTRHVSTNPGSP